MPAPEAPFFSFDLRTAPITRVDEIYVYALLSTAGYWNVIRNMANQIDPRQYVTLVNLNGARKSFEDMQTVWHAHGITPDMYEHHFIYYTSTKGTTQSGEDIEARIPVTAKMVKGKLVYSHEDMGDTRKTSRAIDYDCRTLGAESIISGAMALKTYHPRQVSFPYDLVGFQMPYKIWAGGGGLDFGTPEVLVDFPRNLDGIVGRIPPQHRDRVLNQVAQGRRLFIDWSKFEGL